MRVGILGLLQECNTFVSAKTTVENFREQTLLTGEPIREAFRDAHHEVGGLFAGLEEAGVEAVPLFLARAMPSGPITSEAREELTATMLGELERALPLDGVLTALHGANVADDVLDLDGEWLRLVRTRVGADVPLIGTLDPHANLSEKMVEHSDALLAYRTNPHIDQRAIGEAAARLMARTLRGEVRPTQAASFPPMVITIEHQHTASPPLSAHFAKADEMLGRPEVLSNSIVLGFPYADVPEMGSATLVVTDGDRELAASQAEELASGLFQDRGSFIGGLVSVDEALSRLSSRSGRTCLLDMGDNVGGGSPGDGTFVLHALRDASVGPAVVCLCDPEAVAKATNVGKGGSVELAVGPKTDSMHGDPFEARFDVVSLADGKFSESEARHGGWTEFDQGPCAALRTDPELTVVVTSKRTAPFSLGQLRCLGLDPTSFRVLVAKGVNAPVAAYSEVCDHFIRVDTPGVTTADVTRLTYHHRRRPMFPFESDYSA